MYFTEPFGAGFVDSVEIGVFSHYGATMHSFLFHRKSSLSLIYWWLSFCFYVFPMCNDQLHMLLLNFCVYSLVSETIPDHRDYRLYVGEKARYRRVSKDCKLGPDFIILDFRFFADELVFVAHCWLGVCSSTGYQRWCLESSKMTHQSYWEKHLVCVVAEVVRGCFRAWIAQARGPEASRPD